MEDERTWTPARLIGLGCVVCLLLCVTCTGATCRYAPRDVVIVDPGRVERMAARILPGAAPLPGQRGYFASRVSSLELAVLGDGVGPPGRPKKLHGTVFYLFSLDRPASGKSPDWQRFAKYFHRAPGSWGKEVRHDFVRFEVDGQVVRARRYWTDDGHLNYRFDLLTRERAVVLIATGPADHFDEQGLHRFLEGIAL